jgi:hypothetical protein
VATVARQEGVGAEESEAVNREAVTTNRLSLLFTGHMVDLPGRPIARFPPDLVPAAEGEIADRVWRHVRYRNVDAVRGFASLARGGDILFHEVCRSFGIATVIVLPSSPEEFLATSVEGLDSGGWPGRFRRLWGQTAADARITLGLPKSAAAFSACNDRLLELAQAHGDVQMIALWDGVRRNSAGGTGDFAERAKEPSGREPDIIHPKALIRRLARQPARMERRRGP